MRTANPFSREFWIDDDDIREAVGPLPTRDPVRQAALSALALENDREQLRADLMRRRRENLEERERIESALDELDALRILETAS